VIIVIPGSPPFSLNLVESCNAAVLLSLALLPGRPVRRPAGEISYLILDQFEMYLRLVVPYVGLYTDTTLVLSSFPWKSLPIFRSVRDGCDGTPNRANPGSRSTCSAECAVSNSWLTASC
jgi:hypothetical protein